jgi:hypothetical protein
MSTDDQIISRAHGLAEDVDETGGEVTVILGGARAARLDPDALTGLTGAALALGQNPMEVYAAGPPLYDPHRTDGDFLAAVSDAEDETAEIIAQAKRLQEETEAALREARAAYDAAAARDPFTSEAAAQQRAEMADAAARVRALAAVLRDVAEIIRRAEHALRRLQAVPEDLGDTYQAAYDLIRRGGKLPADGDWLTGEDSGAPVTGVYATDEAAEAAVLRSPRHRAVLEDIARKSRAVLLPPPGTD